MTLPNRGDIASASQVLDQIVEKVQRDGPSPLRFEQRVELLTQIYCAERLAELLE